MVVFCILILAKRAVSMAIVAKTCLCLKVYLLYNFVILQRQEWKAHKDENSFMRLYVECLPLARFLAAWIYHGLLSMCLGKNRS